jgi:hypothetical protein
MPIKYHLFDFSVKLCVSSVNLSETLFSDYLLMTEHKELKISSILPTP